MLALATLPAIAQSSLQRLVGHTVTEQIDISGAIFGTAGTYSIGARLDSSFLSDYKGCRIIGMKVAAACDLGRSRMFLYNMTDDGPVILHEQNQRLYTGWNEISFSGNGYTISGDETYFFGFDYNETQEMVNAQKGGVAAVGSDTTAHPVVHRKVPGALGSAYHPGQESQRRASAPARNPRVLGKLRPQQPCGRQFHGRNRVSP